MNKSVFSTISFLFMGFFFLFSSLSVFASGVLDRTIGMILLQVESHGEAWYVNPVDSKRYYMKDGDIAYEMLRQFGLGITNSDLSGIEPVESAEAMNASESVCSSNALASRLRGRILLQVEAHGEAWYVHPAKCKMIYMRNGAEAYKIMRYLGLGITNTDLDTIEEGEAVLSTASQLDLFESDSDFDDFVNDLILAYDESHQFYGYSDGLGGMTEESETPAAAPEADKSEGESITNVQEEGVDEGGIVKAYGDFFVVLRRGRLFSINSQNLSLVDTTTAYPQGLTPGSWYDELLISDDTVLVLGYRYDWSQAEISLFKINSSGRFTHDSTYFIDADDYYSSRNYSTRLVDGKLVMYLPSYLLNQYYDYNLLQPTTKVRIPHLYEWVGGDEQEDLGPIVDKTNIYRPVQPVTFPTLHTVLSCNIESGFDCDARGTIGPYSRTFYVSPDAAYVWISDWHNPYYYITEDIEGDDEIEIIQGANAHVYRFDLGSLVTQVVKADGQPLDQFSFKDDGEYLNVLVTSQGYGDAMWNPEFGGYGDLALFRIPLRRFGEDLDEPEESDFVDLSETANENLDTNRFVGDYLLYEGSFDWWYLYGESGSTDTLYVYDYPSGGEVQEVSVGHGIDRIEVLGDDAIVIGEDDEDLMLSTVNLGESSRVADNYTIPNASEGESRSHGFYFKESEGGGGTIGLPIRYWGGYYDSLYADSAEVRFFSVDETNGLRDLGGLESSPYDDDPNIWFNDSCVASCVDWYGNSRPIFYQGKVFGLIGYELIEGLLSESAIVEVGRLDFWR